MRGKCLSSGAVVKNLAVCSQPMAIFGSGAAAAVGSEAEEVMMGWVRRAWQERFGQGHP